MSDDNTMPSVTDHNTTPNVDASDVGSEDELQADRGKESRKSQATRLVELASEADIELFHTPEGNSYIRLATNTHIEAHPLHTKAVRRWLARLYYEATGTTPGSQAMQDALAVLDGQAQYDGPARPVFVRVARHDENIYVDLANAEWQAIEITKDGWRVVDNPPVAFRRPKGMLPLPMPEEGGTLDELWNLVNIREEDRPLLAALLVAAFRPEGPYPVAIATGEQGGAKTTLMREARALIDPSSAPVRSAPRNVQDLMIAASNSWMPVYDNLSRVEQWLSDAFCRLSTGGGFAARELYSDAEETILDAQRPLCLTSIEDIADRGDLLDRALIFSLPPIPNDKRLPEKQLWAKFEEVRPRVLGVLCTAVAAAIRNLPTTTLKELPRMADFALWATAAESGFGLESGTFMKAYTANRQSANALVLEADPIAGKIVDLMRERDTWEDTASELLKALKDLAADDEKEAKWWPKQANWFSNRLTRLASNLRQLGVDIEFTRTSKGRIITIGKGPRYSDISDTAITTARETAYISDATAWKSDAIPMGTDPILDKDDTAARLSDDDVASDTIIPTLSNFMPPPTHSINGNVNTNTSPEGVVNAPPPTHPTVSVTTDGTVSEENDAEEGRTTWII